MEFRPCIDIHNGKVKQIVGGSLKDMGNQAKENFVSGQDARFYAGLYKSAGIKGGHIILLNAADSQYYEESRRQALAALREYPGGLQIGGGITPQNAAAYLEEGASHVIVTSYVFLDGKIHYERLKQLVEKVGRRRLVLDVSCRCREDAYYVVTNRWQQMTEEKVDEQLLFNLGQYCDEFLIHAVDVEGKAEGIERRLVDELGMWTEHKITYAGGIHSFDDLRYIKQAGKNRINVTVGSALDLFGGCMKWEEVLALCRQGI